MNPTSLCKYRLGACLLALSVGAFSAQGSLVNRYSFNETSGTTASDSVGGLDGILFNNASFNGSGQVLLTGNGGSDYVQLPAGLITTLTNVSFEVWYTQTNIAQPQARLFDFGDSDGTVGLDYVLLSLPPTGNLHGQLNPGATAANNIDTPAPAAGVTHHVVFTIDSGNHVAALYVDGQLKQRDTSWTPNPTAVSPMANCWLGRSQYSADNYFYGSYDEFRIWNQVLGAAEIAATYESGPDTVNTNAGTLNSINLAVSTSTYLNSVFTPVLLASYSGLTNTPDINLAPGVVYTSSNTNIIRYTNGVFLAVSNGTATLTATYQSLTSSRTVTVAPEPVVLKNRYSFNETGGNGTTIIDSISGSNGTLIATSATVGNGRYTSTDTNQNYIQLPSYMLSGLTNVTFQFWVNWTGQFNATATRFFDFGTNNGTAGVRWIQMSPNANSVPLMQARFVINDGSGAAANWLTAFPTNQEVCVSGVFNGLGGVEKMYVNGRLVASLNTPKQLSSIQDFSDYIGKSAFAADPNFVGSFNEFRLYKGAMSDFDVAVTAAAGPDDIVTNAGALVSLSVTPSSTNLDAHGAITPPIFVKANFANVTNVDVSTLSPATTFSSSDTNVAIVSSGVIYPVGAGTATITATYNGTTGSMTVTVTDTNSWATLLHRYSFNAAPGSTSVPDGATVAPADAVPQGTYTFTGTELSLPGGAGSVGANPAAGYVNLTNGILANAPGDVTFEAWVKWNGVNAQERIFDFGLNASGEDNSSAVGAGSSYVQMTPNDGGNPTSFTHVEVYSNGVSQVILRGPLLTPNVTNHLVYTHDEDHGVDRLYINGVRQATVVDTMKFSNIADVNDWLGRSQWSGDRYFGGSFYEFRIWKGAMTDGQVAAAYAAGINLSSVPPLSVSRSSNNIVVSWPATALQYTLQSSSSLSAASWSSVAITPKLVNSNLTVTLPVSNNTTFYRLQY